MFSKVSVQTTDNRFNRGHSISTLLPVDNRAWRGLLSLGSFPQTWEWTQQIDPDLEMGVMSSVC